MGINRVAEGLIEGFLKWCCADVEDGWPVDHLKDVGCNERGQLAYGEGWIAIEDGIDFQKRPKEAVGNGLDVCLGVGGFLYRADQIDVVDALAACDVVGPGPFRFACRHDDVAEIAGEERLQ